MKSGDSASNISADETGQDSTAGASSPGPFRFPKTKKSLMSDWLQVWKLNKVQAKKKTREIKK